MSMNLAKQAFSNEYDYLVAGPAEINTAVKEAAAALKRGAPVVLDSAGKLATVTVSGGPGTYKTESTGLYGIMAEDTKIGEQGVVYLTGEFFADALVLPPNGSAGDLEVPMRNLGIFLK